MSSAEREIISPEQKGLSVLDETLHNLKEAAEQSGDPAMLPMVEVVIEEVAKKDTELSEHQAALEHVFDVFITDEQLAKAGEADEFKRQLIEALEEEDEAWSGTNTTYRYSKSNPMVAESEEEAA